MKKYVFIIAIMLGLVSCVDYLDIDTSSESTDTDVYTEEIVFNNFQSVRGYFDKVYDWIDDYLEFRSQDFQRCFLTAEMSDEAGNVWKLRSDAEANPGMASLINRGLWSGSGRAYDNLPEVGWNDANLFGDEAFRGNAIPKSFYGIRIASRILEKVPDLSYLTQDQKDGLLGQAHFFRGWFYFELIRRVGGFVPMDRMFSSDESGNMERLTYAESSEYIIHDMDAAIEYLPHKWDDGQTGRATKSSAYALKSMAQLYAASPLMRNSIDRIDQYTDYDDERVKLAAKYANDCLKYIEENRPDQMMMSTDDYPNCFHFPVAASFVSKESLWYKRDGRLNREVDLTAYWQCWTMTNRRGTNGVPNVCPNQTIIDKFETKDGYSIQLTSTGWVSDDPGFKANPDEPFNNRDPRFYQFILLPGERFGTRINNTNGVPATEKDANAFYLANWYGGNESPELISASTTAGRGDILTGYLCKKYQWPETVNGAQDANNPGYKQRTFNSVHIRTTQVWLDYAEAMNEAYGPTGNPEGYVSGSAVDALNKVRNRAGHCNVRSEYTAGKEKFRNKIRDERAVELLFENHRWFDIRRWMIAEELFKDPNPIKGVIVQIKPGKSSLNSTFLPPGNTFEERENAKYGSCFNYVLNNNIPEEVRVFNRRNYWYPMRRDEVNRYPAFKQNPGW